MLKDYIKNNALIIVLSFICLLSLSFAIGKFVKNKNMIYSLEEMYYIETVETKEKYFLLEIETSPLLTFDLDNEEAISGILHFKNGDVCNALIDKDKNLFYIDNAPDKKLTNKIFKFNKTLYQVKKQEEKHNDYKDSVRLENEK